MRKPVGSGPLFAPGAVYATPGTIEVVEGNVELLLTLLLRHMAGDWGDLCQEDRALNEYALVNGGRLFSAYAVGRYRIWIITEAEGLDGQRAMTTVLLPEEY